MYSRNYWPLAPGEFVFSRHFGAYFFFQRFFSEFLFLNKHLHIFTIWAASDPKKPCQRALRYAKTVPTLAAYAEVADSVLIMVRWPEVLSF